MEQELIKLLMDGGALAILLYACITLWKAYQAAINARIEDLKDIRDEDKSQMHPDVSK